MAYTTIDDPSAYFQVKTYTGTGSSNAITFDGNSDMQPDWVWIKQDNGTFNHYAFDSVRGVNKPIHPNLTNAESSQSDTLMSFNSDGFTLGDDSTNGEINANTQTFVSWNWKAGTTGSGTTGGSGTGKAYSYSVSTDSGFSIVKYIGNGTNGHTIPHHLGAVPKILWEKVTAGNTNNWGFYNHAVGNDKAMYMDGTSAETDDSFLNDTTPTSTVVTLGSNMTNQDGKTFIMYLFAEKKGYSKFGEFTGNNQNDGTFVNLGFQPEFFFVKRTDSSDDWKMVTRKMQSTNPVNKSLKANTNAAQATESDHSMDLLSNGFKFRENNAAFNASGTYAYMAWARNPLVTSTGIPGLAK